MFRAMNWKNNQEISVYHHSSTYPKCGVALEGTGVDLDICTVSCINSTTLEVACPAPGIGAKF
jgi:hypothetical protein